MEASKPSHLPAIAALRGIAALYVVLFHMTYLPRVEPPGWLLSFVTSGYSGVPLFFIISAFTLCHTSLGRAETHPTLRFYGRRVIRIMPLFYCVLVVELARRILLSHQHISSRIVLLNAAVLFNFVPGKEQGIVMASWSIGVEMLFYAMFPWLFRRVNNIRRALVFFVVSVVVSALFSLLVDRLRFPPATRDDFFRFSLLRSMPCFAVGMIVFWVYRSPWMASLSHRMGAWLLLAGVAAFFALVSLNMNNSRPAAAIHAVPYGILVLGCLGTNFKGLVNRFTEFCGEISYSLYLWHSLVILSVMGLYRAVYARLPHAIAWFICLGLTLAVLFPVAYASYRFIEEPTRKAASRSFGRWVDRLTAVEGAAAWPLPARLARLDGRKI